MKKTITIIFLFVLTLNIFAVQNSFDFKTYSIRDGLSQNYIKCIYQDAKGFLWIGTGNGLNKFDGYKFTHFKFNPSDSTTISNNRITAITNLDNDNILVGTDFGFNIINSITGKCIRKYLPTNVKGQIASNAIKVIFKDSKGKIFIGTFGGGLFTYNPEDESFNNVLNDPENKGDSSFDYILSIHEDKSEKLWIASYGGLAVFDKKNKSFKNYKPQTGDKYSLTHKIVTSIRAINEDSLWIGTVEGLNIFDKQTERFYNYKNSKEIYFDKNNITDFHFSRNKLWLSTASAGISIYDFNKKNLVKLSVDSKDNPLPENTVTKLLKDKSGIIWAGTGDSGLLKFVQNQKEFNSFRFSSNDGSDNKRNTVFNIYEDDANILWLGTQFGLYKKINDNFIPQFQNEINNKTVTSILKDSRGNLLIGTTNGFFIYETKTKRLKSYFQNRKDFTQLKSDAISIIFESTKNEIWLGTLYEGIIKYDYNSDSFYNYPCAMESDTSLLGYNVSSIIEDDNNNLWIGTLRGLSKFNPTENKFINYTHNPNNQNSLPTNSILTLFYRNNILWIGTYGGGLVKYENTHFKTFIEKDGLPSSVISKIIYDRDKLWLSTDKGISEYNFSSNVFSSYGFDDGLQTIDYNTGAGTKLENGEIYFGSSNGITFFNPNKIVKNNFAPATIITSIKIFNEEKIQDYFNNSILDLAYDNNFLSIEFAALDFTNTSKNKFKYLLSNRNKDWVELNERHYVDFANLEPGEYNFKVKGSNNDLNWSEQSAELNFIVHPPFWNTWWFFIIILLFITSVIYAIHRYAVYQKTNHLLELNKIRLEAADDFHDHVGHTLTRISLFTELLKKNITTDNPKASEYINKISSASALLYNEAKDFIWSLDPKNDSLYELAIYIKDFGEDFFSRTGILFNCNEISEELKKYSISMKTKREIIFIFKEVMNNALKHSRAENVFLNIFVKNGLLFFTFKDDGLGIIKDSTTMGRGLKSIATRAEKINFNLEISDENTKGTSVSLKANLRTVTKND